ncbi:MAG TPA: hypothetical protein VN775_13910 [Opitutaceae bacterium]|nr:hypothetical protein [Opitutaceae bacterium]
MQGTEQGPPPAYPARTAFLTAAAVLSILFLRRPESFLHPQLYAEDGGVFFLGACRDPWGSILVPYAGYLHLGARLVAALCSWLNPLWIPAAYFSVSVGAVLALTLALFSQRVGLPHPGLFALAIVLVPHNGEVFDNLTNVQWIGAIGLIVLLLARDPERPSQWLLDFACAAVISLTGVFSVLFAPLFAARAAIRRTFASIGIACFVLAGAAIQVREILHFPLPATAGEKTAYLALATFGQRVSMSLLSPPSAPDAATLLTRALAGSAGLALLVVLGLGIGPDRLRRMVFAASLLLLAAAAIYRFRGGILELASVHNGDRYFFGPKVFFLWILLLHLRRASALRWLSGALLAAILLNCCLSFRFERWKDYDWPYWVGRMASEDRVVVPINPPGYIFIYERP